MTIARPLLSEIPQVFRPDVDIWPIYSERKFCFIVALNYNA